jgi:hypothetical protein
MHQCVCASLLYCTIKEQIIMQSVVCHLRVRSKPSPALLDTTRLLVFLAQRSSPPPVLLSLLYLKTEQQRRAQPVRSTMSVPLRRHCWHLHNPFILLYSIRTLASVTAVWNDLATNYNAVVLGSDGLTAVPNICDSCTTPSLSLDAAPYSESRGPGRRLARLRHMALGPDGADFDAAEPAALTPAPRRA